jgi:hypothetical protein
MPAGRPLKYQPQEFADKIESYFEWCDGQKTILYNDAGQVVKVIEKPYTITGLCVYIGTSKETLREYMLREEFVDAIKKAKLRIENYCEEGSLTGRLNTIASIFNLKNNFDWKDKQEIEVNDITDHASYEELKRKAKDLGISLD